MKGELLNLFLHIFVAAVVVFTCFVIYEEGKHDALEEMKQYPSAMDVYQGKTTLQYTVVDGVKTDSVVVFNSNKIFK